MKMFPARYIYKLVEPDPLEPPNQPVSPVARYRFKYPKDANGKSSTRFDSEAMFWHSGNLYLLAKGSAQAGMIFRVDAKNRGRHSATGRQIGTPVPNRCRCIGGWTRIGGM